MNTTTSPSSSRTLRIRVVLQHLSLDNNDLGDDDVQALIEGLKPNGSLTSCSVQGNLRVSPSVSHRLDQSLTLNRHPKFKPFIPRLSADDDILRTLEFAGLQLDDLCIEILVEVAPIVLCSLYNAQSGKRIILDTFTPMRKADSRTVSFLCFHALSCTKTG